MLYVLLAHFWMLVALPPHVVSECSAPARIAPGEAGDVVWTVHCSDLPNAARFELILPEGLTAIASIGHGGRWVHAGDRVRYVWESLPPGPVLRVGVRVTADRAFRTSSLEPTLSYSVGGERHDAQLQPVALAAKFDAPSTPTTARRKIQTEGQDVARVTVTVTGLEPGTFVRIEETLPAGCTAEADLLDGATCTADRSGLRFVWFEGLATGSTRISYRVMGTSAAHFDEIQGTVTHVKGGVRVKTPIQLEAVPQPEASVAPATSVGTLFHVQLLAAHRTVRPEFFTQRHRFLGEVDRWNHEGWTKYTTGAHTTYAEARRARNAIRAAHRFPGPFVTASHAGRRITVQEALLLTSQTWTPE